MAGRYHVSGTRSFEREAGKLIQRNPRLEEALVEAVAILETDPFNLLQQADIRKLVGVRAGEGRYRFRIGDYRLRYDVSGDEVRLYGLHHRRESYR